jgi:DNA-directed RNA polymerase omega subunit
MNYVTSDELIGKVDNKYEAVVVAALRARQLNLLQKKQHELAQEEAQEEEVEDILDDGIEKEPKREAREKVTVLAMRELLNKKITYQREQEKK